MDGIHKQQEKAVEFLIELNKWIVGLTFGSATGCIAVLKNGVSSAMRVYLISAIFFFAVSILICGLVFVLLPTIIQKLPVHSKSKETANIYDFRLISAVTLRHLIGAQYLFFVLGIVGVFMWVLLGK